jgi:hypothetical protein
MLPASTTQPYLAAIGARASSISLRRALNCSFVSVIAIITFLIFYIYYNRNLRENQTFVSQMAYSSILSNRLNLFLKDIPLVIKL